ncbi:MAG: hypothetical protein RR549_06375 [Oscillospiraceae bacterium]
MKIKKIISLLTCVSILAVTALTASAADVSFGGQTSGGTLGKTNIVGKISTTSSAAYKLVAGFNTPDMGANFAFNVVGHLYITRDNYGNKRIVDKTFDSFGGGNEIGVAIAKYGAETNFPPNNQNGYVYQKVVVDVNYSSSTHGSWVGSGTMNY